MKKISEIIRELERIRDEYGNVPVYVYSGGGENEPTIEVSKSRWRMDENYEMFEEPAMTRVVIK